MENNVLNILTKYLNTEELMVLKHDVENEDLNKLFNYIIEEGNKSEYFKMDIDKDKVLHIDIPIKNIIEYFKYLESKKNKC